MDFNQFKGELRDALSEKISKELDGTLELGAALKNGGPQEVIIYKCKNSKNGIQIGIASSYEAFQMGYPVELIAEKLMLTIKENAPKLEKEFKGDMIRPENIIPALIPTKGNEELLKTIPHISFENLQIIFKFKASDFGDGLGTVPYAYLEEMGWDENQLLEIATNNPMYKNEMIVCPLEKVVLDCAPISGVDLEELKELSLRMVIVTNSLQSYGAAVILDKDIMGKLSDIFNDNLYIIPSSVHECLVMPESECSPDLLKMMVYDVNREAVEIVDRLSDDIYVFDSLTKEITLVNGERMFLDEKIPEEREKGDGNAMQESNDLFLDSDARDGLMEMVQYSVAIPRR
ncbi:DUF5688 family protein [Lachnospiraceae bacterium 48-21]